MRASCIFVLCVCALDVEGLVSHHAASMSRRVLRVRGATMQHTQGWDGFGKGPFAFYSTFDEFMSPFPDEDRETYPEMFQLPTGVIEVTLPRPLGIAFEEVDAGQGGVLVTELVEGGNAAADGSIHPGDILVAVTACKQFGPRSERKLLPARELDFDTIMGAIGSNEPRYRARDVVLHFMRPSKANEERVKEFYEFFQIPYDHVFRTG